MSDKEFMSRLENESDTGWRAARTIRDLQEDIQKRSMDYVNLLNAIRPLAGPNGYYGGSTPQATVEYVSRLVDNAVKHSTPIQDTVENLDMILDILEKNGWTKPKVGVTSAAKQIIQRLNQK